MYKNCFFVSLLVVLFALNKSIYAQEIGDFYQGGYVISINDDGTGLIAAAEDILDDYNFNLGLNTLNFFLCINVIFFIRKYLN